MGSDDWKKVKALLEDVLDLEPDKRQAFLSDANASPETRREVESLLAFEDRSDRFLMFSAVDILKDCFEDDTSGALIGQQIGPYRVVSELGSGGMGAVFLAERTDQKFEQRVALKLLKRELNTSELRRRFQVEREILASLEHPNIARLLDAGTSEDGTPFIAMEYVDGLSIVDYCNVHNLDLNDRLQLFRKVCAAVEYAHQNLIVHRDLKPSNVLVTLDGTPKLLDFGISKILMNGQSDADAATITRLGVMTPSYASPEQLLKKSVTTLSDVYSLGVILFELLSSHRPFEEKEHDLREIYDAVIEKEPVPPSTMIGKAPLSIPEKNAVRSGERANEAETRREHVRRTGPTPMSLSSQSVRGDLDNIVLKAMRKEPERRYSSVSNLADDIQRHLMGLTVTARPNTFAYRTSKFVKRNRASVTAAAVVALAIVAGLVATMWQARVAQAERAKAEKRFNDVRALANSNLFDVYPAVENLEGSLKAREAILTNVLAYLDSLSSEDVDDRELQGELATAYEKVGDVQGALNNSSLGNIKAGLQSYEKAQKLREAILASDPGDLEAKEKLANNYYVMGRTLWNDSQTKLAEETFLKALVLRRELVAIMPDSVQMKDRLAVLLLDYGAIPVFNYQSQKALTLFDEALQIIEELRRPDPENPNLKKTLTRGLRILSKAKSALGQHDSAISDLKYAIEVSHELANHFPQDFRVQRSVWLTQTVLCEIYIDRGTSADVVDACQVAIPFPTDALQKEPENGVVAFDLAISHFNLSRAHRLADDHKAAIASAKNAIKVMNTLAAKSPENLEYRRNLAIYNTEIARAQLKLEQIDGALGILDKVIVTLVPIAEADKETTTYRYDIAVAHRLTAHCLARKGESARAIEHIDKAIVLIKELQELNSLSEGDKDLLAELEQERSQYGGTTAASG